VIPGRGAWLEFDIDKKDTLGVGSTASAASTSPRSCAPSIARPTRRCSPSSTVLRGRSRNTSRRTPTEDRDEALLDLYRKLRPGELTTVESARSLINTLFYNPKRYDLTRVGRYKLNQKFGGPRPPRRHRGYRAKPSACCREEDILDTIRTWCPPRGATRPPPARDPGLTDDIDHFGNRRVRTVGELIQNQIRVGLTRWSGWCASG
jgi:DNA-directed RNA polymerase subunit beta